MSYYANTVSALRGLSVQELRDLRREIDDRLGARARYIRNFPFTPLEKVVMTSGFSALGVIPVIRSIRERDLSLSLREAKAATDCFRCTLDNLDSGFLSATKDAIMAHLG